MSLRIVSVSPVTPQNPKVWGRVKPRFCSTAMCPPQLLVGTFSTGTGALAHCGRGMMLFQVSYPTVDICLDGALNPTIPRLLLFISLSSLSPFLLFHPRLLRYSAISKHVSSSGKMWVTPDFQSCVDVFNIPEHPKCHKTSFVSNWVEPSACAHCPQNKINVCIMFRK